jgi:hypothetical protein
VKCGRNQEVTHEDNIFISTGSGTFNQPRESGVTTVLDKNLSVTTL